MLFRSTGLGNPAGTFYSGSNDQYGTRFYCVDIVQNIAVLNEQQVDNAFGPIDWDCRQPPLSSNTAADITGETGTENGKTIEILQSLNGWDDWGNLNYLTGAIGEAGAPPAPAAAPLTEITVEQDAKILTTFGVSVTGPGNLGLALGQSTTLIFDVQNKGTAPDTYSLLATTSEPWANITGVPAQVTLGPGASQAIQIPVQVGSSDTTGNADQILLRALSQHNSKIYDIARSIITSGSADLAVSISANTSQIIGSPLIQTITVSNRGSDVAQNVSLIETLPAGLVPVSATSQGLCNVSSAVVCALGTVAPGANVTTKVTTMSSSAGTFVSSATVSSSVFDPILANNTGSTSTTIIGKPSISAQVTNVALNGNTLTLTLSLTNVGSGVADKLAISKISLRPLEGSGTVSYVSPAIPVPIGNLQQGASSSVGITIGVSGTVTRLELTELGNAQDSGGNLYNFSMSQAVSP